jgi:acetyltransferase-like isoleucine patch superfamily enzyme
MNKLKKMCQRYLAKLYLFLIDQNRHFQAKYYLNNKILFMGKYTYGIPNIDIYKGSEARVIIGNFCSIAKGVTMITGGIHPVNWISTYPFRIHFRLNGAYQDGMPSTNGNIIIGNDVFIGTDAVIFSGVKIGDGAVIGARAVVTNDIPPYAIAAGVPAKVIKYRFNKTIISNLLAIKWWEWPDNDIIKIIPLLSSDKIDVFLNKYGG